MDVFGAKEGLKLLQANIEYLRERRRGKEERIGGSPKFIAMDIDVPLLKAKLKERSNLNDLVLKLLGVSRGNLHTVTEDEIVKAFNTILEMRDLHTKVNVDANNLSPEVRELLERSKDRSRSAKGLLPNELVTLNRALLQASFPLETKRSQRDNDSLKNEIKIQDHIIESLYAFHHQYYGQVMKRADEIVAKIGTDRERDDVIAELKAMYDQTEEGTWERMAVGAAKEKLETLYPHIEWDHLKDNKNGQERHKRRLGGLPLAGLASFWLGKGSADNTAQLRKIFGADIAEEFIVSMREQIYRLMKGESTPFRRGDVDTGLLKEALEKGGHKTSALILETLGVTKDNIDRLTEDQILNAFNSLLEREDFYKNVYTSGFDLSPEMNSLLRRVDHPTPETVPLTRQETVTLNKALLQATYPKVLALSKSGYVYSGKNEGEFVTELEGENIKGELEVAIQKFNTFFISEYGVVRVDTAGLSEDEIDTLTKQLEENKTLEGILVSRHGTGLNVLVKRSFRLDEEIVEDVKSSGITREVISLNIETDRIGLFTASVGAVNGQHLLDYVVEKLFAASTIKGEHKTKDEILKNLTEERIVIDENGNEQKVRFIKSAYINQFYDLGMKYADAMLQEAKKDKINEKTGEYEKVGRFKVEVSHSNPEDPLHIGKVAENSENVEEAEARRTKYFSLNESLKDIREIRERITNRIKEEEKEDYKRRVAAATLPQTYEAGRKFFSFFGVKNVPNWAIRVFFSMHYELPKIIFTPYSWFKNHERRPIFVVSVMMTTLVAGMALVGVLPYTDFYVNFLFSVPSIVIGTVPLVLSLWLAHGVGNTMAELLNKFFGREIEKMELHKSINKEVERLNPPQESREKLKNILDMLLSGEPEALKMLREFEENLQEWADYEKLLEKMHGARFIYLAQLFNSGKMNVAVPAKKRSPEEILRGVRFSTNEEIQGISNQELAEITSLLNNLLEKSREEGKSDKEVSNQILVLGLSLAHGEGFNDESLPPEESSRAFKDSLRAFKGFVRNSYPNTEFSLEFEQKFKKYWEKGREEKAQGLFVPTVLKSDEIIKEIGEGDLTHVELVNMEGLTPTAIQFLANRIRYLNRQYKDGNKNNRIYLTGVKADVVPKLMKELKKLKITPGLLKSIDLDLERDITQTSDDLEILYTQIATALLGEQRTIGSLDLFTEKMKFKKSKRNDLQIRVLMIFSSLQLIDVTEEMSLFEKADEMISLSK